MVRALAIPRLPVAAAGVALGQRFSDPMKAKVSRAVDTARPEHKLKRG